MIMIHCRVSRQHLHRRGQVCPDRRVQGSRSRVVARVHTALPGFSMSAMTSGLGLVTDGSRPGWKPGSDKSYSGGIDPRVVARVSRSPAGSTYDDVTDGFPA
jgi:hypothetical protein